MTRVRDAATDPESTDFLPPVSGISPGIHGEQGVRPITPGAVSSTASTQEAAESAEVPVWQGGQAFTSIAVTPATASVVEAATQQLAVVATMTDETTTVTVTDVAVYVSDDEEVATVDASGLVTGVATGEATITASYKGHDDTCVVTVTAE
jgi:uncharacterized protein YjdB